MADDAMSVPFSINRFVHYAGIALLTIGGLYYVWAGLPRMKPAVDAREAEALALVQSHPAVGFPTILQAMSDHVRSMKERGQGVRLGEWRVKHVEGDLYEVRVQLRDQSVRGQWFEREFIWHAHLDVKRVNAASLPADGLMPKPAEMDQSATSAAGAGVS